MPSSFRSRFFIWKLKPTWFVSFRKWQAVSLCLALLNTVAFPLPQFRFWMDDWSLSCLSFLSYLLSHSTYQVSMLQTPPALSAQLISHGSHLKQEAPSHGFGAWAEKILVLPPPKIFPSILEGHLRSILVPTKLRSHPPHAYNLSPAPPLGSWLEHMVVISIFHCMF